MIHILIKNWLSIMKVILVFFFFFSSLGKSSIRKMELHEQFHAWFQTQNTRLNSLPRSKVKMCKKHQHGYLCDC